MSLTIIESSQDELLDAAAVRLLREGMRTSGRATLLVPSYEHALRARRDLAGMAGLALGVTAATPAEWMAERWEVWGDGRTIVGRTVLAVIARELLEDAGDGASSAFEPTTGLADILALLADQALPWIDRGEDGHIDAQTCRERGLTERETQLVCLLDGLAERLAMRGLVTRSQALCCLAGELRSSRVEVAPVVVVGFDWMGRIDRELLRLMAGMSSVSLVVRAGSEGASQRIRQLEVRLREACDDAVVVDALQTSEARETRTSGKGSGSTTESRAQGLSLLRKALYREDPVLLPADGSLALLQAAGPLAEAELVARHVRWLADTLTLGDALPELVIAVPDVVRAERELVPKLLARGLSVRLKGARALTEVETVRCFLGYATAVARLKELDDSWPAPIDSDEGPLRQLGSMDWWPPRELTDFLLSDCSGMSAAAAWRLDAKWRGDRLLSPGEVLRMLTAERLVSAAVAHATTELLRGRMSTAIRQLLLPREETGHGSGVPPRSPESEAALQELSQLLVALRELGYSCDEHAEHPVSLGHLVELCAQMAASKMAKLGGQALQEGGALVSVMGLSAAAQLPAASVDALIVCGQTSAEQPLDASDDLASALLELLGIEPPDDPVARMRAQLAHLVSLPRRALVFERSLHDGDAKPTYPSVQLSEVLDACGPSLAEGETGRVVVWRLSETELGRNLSTDGHMPTARMAAGPAPAGVLTPAVSQLVFVPQTGRIWEHGAPPVLSASQIETYLECPYKWFSLRRLRLGSSDAGYGGVEMGSFAHRVLELTHRELLGQALEALDPTSSREELLEALERDPLRQVPGSAIDEDRLETAQQVLQTAFDDHLRHMYLTHHGNTRLQLLVPHDSFERTQEERLREDLLSALGFETRILRGFEPRFFEWGFGRHEEPVPYAGAYLVGTVDRIDVDAHGLAVITDYKHKRAGGFAGEYDAIGEGVLEGVALPRHVQSLIYAQVVRRAFEGRLKLVGTTYFATRKPHVLAGAVREDLIDRIMPGVASSRMSHVAVPSQEGAMEELLDNTERLVAEQVERMRQGDIEARPRDERSCDFCPVMQCERRVVR